MDFDSLSGTREIVDSRPDKAMSRSLILLAMLAVGCESSAPISDSSRLDGWAYAMSGAATWDRTAGPDEDASGKCATCNGTGRVGDGRVFSECLDCGGDGVVDGDESADPDPGPVPIVWLEDFDDARQASRDQQKPILIYVGTDWCAYCPPVWQEMNKQENESLLRRFVLLKIDGDRSPAWVRRWGVHSYPTVIVANVGAELFYKHAGARGVTGFIERRVQWATRGQG